MGLEITTLSEVKSEKLKYHMISLACEIENTTQRNISTKQEQTHREQRGSRRGSGMGICALEVTIWFGIPAGTLLRVTMRADSNGARVTGGNQDCARQAGCMVTLLTGH